MVFEVDVVVFLELANSPDAADVVLYPGCQLEDVRLGLESGFEIFQHLFPRPPVEFITDHQQCPLLGLEVPDELLDGLGLRLRLTDDGRALPAKASVALTDYLAIATDLPVSTDLISARVTANASRASAGVTTVGVVSFSTHSRKYSISL